MAVQLAGVEKLEGTYPFSIEVAVRAFRINEYLQSWSSRLIARRSCAIPRRASRRPGLSEEERDMLRRRDWRGLLHYGVIFFMLEKLGAVVGVSNLHIYAAMRGETLEAFQTHAKRAGRVVLGGR